MAASRRVHRAAVAAVALTSMCAVAAVSTAAASASKNGPPLINIEGSTYATTRHDPTGLPTRQVFFAVEAKESRDGTVSGTFTGHNANVLPDGTQLSPLSSNDVDISCLSADQATHTVWFSGRVTAGFDLRLPTELQAQEQQIIDDGNLILWMRLSDTDGDGIVDKTSFIVWNATAAYPNALRESSDNGMVFNPWWIEGNGTSAATACLLHDDLYSLADYKVVDGPGNLVQWVAPDNVTTIGSPFIGTAANLSNPPAGSVFNISSFTLTPLAPTLELKIR